MPRFSVVMVVDENYQSYSLQSILNQSIQDYEIIIVDVSNTDKCKNIIQKMLEECKDKVKYIHKKNMKFPMARNEGVKRAKGEYIIFLEQHGSIEKNLLKTLEKKLKDSPDIIRFQMKEIGTSGVKMYRELPFETLSGVKSFSKIQKYYCIDKLECYAYKKNLWVKYWPSIFKEMEVEYFAFIPFLILQSSKVKSLGYIGYVVHPTEAPNNRIEGFNGYQQFEKYIRHTDAKHVKLLQSYVAHTMIKKSIFLKSKEYKKYVAELNAHDIFKYIENPWYKKYIMRKSPKMYYKINKGEQ